MDYKIQRPVFPEDGHWLIYNEERTVEFELVPQLIPAQWKVWMSTSYKFYARGPEMRTINNGNVTMKDVDVLLTEKITTQSW